MHPPEEALELPAACSSASQHAVTAAVLVCLCCYTSESLNKLLADLWCLQVRCSRHFPYCCHRVRHTVLPAKVFPPDTRQPHDYSSLLLQTGESAPKKGTFNVCRITNTLLMTGKARRHPLHVKRDWLTCFWCRSKSTRR